MFNENRDASWHQPAQFVEKIGANKFPPQKNIFMSISWFQDHVCQPSLTKLGDYLKSGTNCFKSRNSGQGSGQIATLIIGRRNF